MSTINQFIEDIKEEMSLDNPSNSKIFSLLREMKNIEEFKALSDTDYYDLIGEIFTVNPEFFMASLYLGMRSLDMAKYIVENYCLYKGEKILYQTRGDVMQENNTAHGNVNVKVTVTGGEIYVTNYRIIAQGMLSVKGGRYWGTGGLIDLMIAPMTGSSSRKRSKQSIILDSLAQELPCYGYQFKTRGHVKIKKKSKAIRYIVFGALVNFSDQSSFKQANMLMKSVRRITITIPKDQVEELFNILCKDTDQTVDMFQELIDIGIKGRMKRNEFLYRLKKLMDASNEEYRSFSDLEQLKVIGGVYELDPEFFTSSLYPNMQKWSLPTYMKLKDQIDELISH